MKIGIRKLKFKTKIKTMVQNENFKKLDIPGCNAYESEYWLKLEKVYVPKSYIVGAYSYRGNTSITAPDELVFVTITGEQIRDICFTYKHREYIDEAVKKFREILPNAYVDCDYTVLHWTYDSKNLKDMKIKAKESMTTVEDCINLITSNRIKFVDILAGKKVNTSSASRVDDSDLYEQEFGKGSIDSRDE